MYQKKRNKGLHWKITPLSMSYIKNFSTSPKLSAEYITFNYYLSMLLLLAKQYYTLLWYCDMYLNCRHNNEENSHSHACPVCPAINGHPDKQAHTGDCQCCYHCHQCHLLIQCRSHVRLTLMLKTNITQLPHNERANQFLWKQNIWHCTPCTEQLSWFNKRLNLMSYDISIMLHCIHVSAGSDT